ncbi:MAG TPA: hypothetical protein VEP90_28235, partial [Methylomirabilota bacterium]|nr:hypothetical protein [Methylomirabilota bacterium]
MGSDKKVSPSADISIGNEVNLFIKYIDSLADTLPRTAFAIGLAQYGVLKEFMAFVEKHTDLQGLADDKIVLQIPHDSFGKFQKLYQGIEKSVYSSKLVLRSFIISLISQYDAFLGRLVRALFLIQPDSLNISERNITFAQLQTFESVEDAREYIIEKEIETVLRKSHFEQFDWLEKKFDIKLHEGLNIWQTFIEVTERRNLFVHNSGIVTGQYLNVCKMHNVELDEDIHIGVELEATPDYFKKAYECIFEIGVKLAQVLWRKVEPADRERADKNLNNICYELLVEERFRLACILLDFATDLKRYSSDQWRRTFIVNRAQAYKWSGDFEKAKKIVTNEDWSAASDKFKLAEAVILDDFDRADGLVKRIGSSDDILNKNTYREWPLFREYRKSEGFPRAFEEVFKEPLQKEPLQLVDIDVTQVKSPLGDFQKILA